MTAQKDRMKRARQRKFRLPRPNGAPGDLAGGGGVVRDATPETIAVFHYLTPLVRSRHCADWLNDCNSVFLRLFTAVFNSVGVYFLLSLWVVTYFVQVQ